MTGFVQIIEFKTTRADELRTLADDMSSGPGQGAALRGTVTEDRDRPGWYFNIVEFDSFEAAMSNSNRPEVSAFAARMAELCEEPRPGSTTSTSGRVGLPVPAQPLRQRLLPPRPPWPAQQRQG